MREIKFRAWDGLRMTIGGIMFSSTDGNVFAAANMPVMQYTGLKDKNGKEIYEGDVVQRGQSCDGLPDDLIEVYFKDGAFVGRQTGACMTLGGFGIIFVLAAFVEEIKVIGNIYENPGLIDGDKE